MAALSGQEKRKASAKLGQKRAVAHRRCPECGRGNALTKVNADEMVAANCRYCGYVRLRSWLLPVEADHAE